MIKPLYNGIAAWTFLLLLPLQLQAGSFSLEKGHVYATNSNQNDILQFSPQGVHVGTLEIMGRGMGFKGMAFAPNGDMLVVTPAAHGFDVLRLDTLGQVTATYPGTTYVFGNSSYGKIAVADDGTFYVAGGGQLLIFDPRVPGTTSIFEGNQVYDVEVLPSGNILVLTAYTLVELTKQGDLVRTLLTSSQLTDARGVEFDSTSSKVFVTMLGNSGFPSHLMRFDFQTSQLEAHISYPSADDLDFMEDGRLVVGAIFNSIALFTQDMGALGPFSADERNFVAVKPEQILIFQDGFE